MSSSEDPRARHQRLQALFLEARALDEAGRAAYLDEACAGDGGLRSELEELLAHDRPAAERDAPSGSPLRRELDALHDLGSDTGEPPIPEFLGEFRILGKLGEGGMGTVYEARQESLQRVVALKVLRPGSFSSQSLRRFAHEGEFLGRLEHPGIARIYELGRADTALGPQPYFAMELVEGVPLTEYAREHDLSIRDRLELVARVADAVQYAHRQGVIHRDLKPDNILVDREGQPKILDFGIARASDSDVQLTTVGTDVGQILGTLAYMSPEQATGDPKALDARSDVYSLGVLMHELLVERLPYDVSRRTLPEALRVIQEQEPPRLSTSNTMLRGDVETIVQTALEKDKARRYATAGSLAADLRHYLRDEPITARPASRIYTLKKFVRRNRTVVVAATLVFLSLTAGLVASLRFALRAEARNAENRKLSALPEIEELFVRADSNELWPPQPDRIEAYGTWMEEARAFLARRSEFEEARARVMLRAAPRSDEELEPFTSERSRAYDLDITENSIRRLETQLLGRSAPYVVVPEVLDWSPSPDDDVDELLARAFAYLDPSDGAQGNDALGLELARRARDLSGPDGAAEAWSLVAWGHYYAGQCREAEWATWEAERALGHAPLARRDPIQFLLEQLSSRIRHVRSSTWFADVRDLIEERKDLAAALRAEMHPGRFADSSDQLWYDLLTVVVQRLDELALRAEGGVSEAHGWSVRKRQDFAEDLRRGFAPDGDYAQAWAELLPAMRADYPGPGFAPQMGLVPLGRDGDSGLWEFAHLASGDPPDRDEDGHLVLTGDGSIVFVLVPEGTFTMGAQSQDPGQPNYVNFPATADTLEVKAVDSREAPPRRVEISRAFFLSKYEVTQGQWKRLTGTSPSPDDRANNLARVNRFGVGDPPLHPVNMISWDDCDRAFWQFGLRLPTSAEWEYGARAGTDSAWWTGDDPRDLRTAANLADQFGLAKGKLDSLPLVESWSDDDAVHARVGSYRPNRFGLHDVHGNLSEWCEDAPWRAVMYQRPFLIDPVSRPAPNARPLRTMLRLHRGGSFADLARFARSAQQTRASRDESNEFIGVRPARDLDPH